MQIIQSKLLNKFPNLLHYFTSREDGNIAFHIEDKIERVMTHHKELAKKLNYDKERLVHMQQVHSNTVYIVSHDENFHTPPQCDALITNELNKPLMVMVADCTPLLFFEPDTNVIAVAHAGRAGAFLNIVKEVLDVFTEKFDAKKEHIHVSVGPNIKQCCYEVGEEIYKEAQALSLEYALTKREGSYYLDVTQIIMKQLLQEGVVEKNIETLHSCSACTKELYSYRRDGNEGRFAGVVMLRESD